MVPVKEAISRDSRAACASTQGKLGVVIEDEHRTDFAKIRSAGKRLAAAIRDIRESNCRGLNKTNIACLGP